MKKNLVFAIVLLAFVSAGYLVYRSFNKFNPGRNPEAPRPQLIVYTHSSFMDAYGPGADIKAAFEEDCLCEVQFLDAGGAGLLLEKLKLAQEPVDVVVGLDQLALKKAALAVKWREFKMPERKWSAIYKKNHYSMFVPYDWAPMTFLYKDSFRPAGVTDGQPIAWKDFVSGLPAQSLSLQDPTLSTPGLQFLFWLYRLAENENVVPLVQQLQPKVHSYSPDWSAAYGLFRRDLVKVTFSYLTSLVYHWKEENDRSYKAVQIQEGHPVQIEYAGVPDTCLACGLAEHFVRFLTTDRAQKILMEKNYMLPVVEGLTEGTPFADLPSLEVMSTETIESFVDGQEAILKSWESARR